MKPSQAKKKSTTTSKQNGWLIEIYETISVKFTTWDVTNHITDPYESKI
jgi:hypothetical protein